MVLRPDQEALVGASVEGSVAEVVSAAVVEASEVIEVALVAEEVSVIKVAEEASKELMHPLELQVVQVAEAVTAEATQTGIPEGMVMVTGTATAVVVVAVVVSVMGHEVLLEVIVSPSCQEIEGLVVVVVVIVTETVNEIGMAAIAEMKTTLENDTMTTVGTTILDRNEGIEKRPRTLAATRSHTFLQRFVGGYLHLRLDICLGSPSLLPACMLCSLSFLKRVRQGIHYIPLRMAWKRDHPRRLIPKAFAVSSNRMAYSEKLFDGLHRTVAIHP